MGNNIILETKFVADISGSFNIPSYQRGYRWSETEVVRLLDDIYQNGKKNYCLQPVVVRKKEDQYELIDGQQRLTTLYLIYKYMKNVNPFFNEPAFTLSYQTRDQSEEFLKTLDMTKQDDNIDFWFIAKAYNTIKEWFEQDLQIRVMHIFEYLKEDVKIIWYEVGESEDAISLFTRLNIGKIPLTSAELVKAMFLSRDNAENMRREKQEEISLQWDGIERELHNESLWFFLTNSVKGEYQTRIDLVLDLIAGKDESTREKYYTFFRFDELRKEVNADKLERTVFESIQQKVLGLLSVSGNTEYMHSIANLALLNTADNAALNNSTFDVKRNDIIQMDKKGQYIPFCTKMVFLKYYTPSAENQLHFWGQADRIAYIKAINDVLSDYIEPIVLEKEETK